MMKSINYGTRRRRRLFERKDVIIVASVSCIYGLGSPEEYRELSFPYESGWKSNGTSCCESLSIFNMSEMISTFTRGTFRVRGDVVEIFPASRDEHCIRVEFFGDEIERIREIDALTGEIIGEGTCRDFSGFPLRHPGRKDEE